MMGHTSLDTEPSAKALWPVIVVGATFATAAMISESVLYYGADHKWWPTEAEAWPWVLGLGSLVCTFALPGFGLSLFGLVKGALHRRWPAAGVGGVFAVTAGLLLVTVPFWMCLGGMLWFQPSRY